MTIKHQIVTWMTSSLTTRSPLDCVHLTGPARHGSHPTWPRTAQHCPAVRLLLWEASTSSVQCSQTFSVTIGLSGGLSHLSLSGRRHLSGYSASRREVRWTDPKRTSMSERERIFRWQTLACTPSGRPQGLHGGRAQGRLQPLDLCLGGRQLSPVGQGLLAQPLVDRL